LKNSNYPDRSETMNVIPAPTQAIFAPGRVISAHNSGRRFSRPRGRLGLGAQQQTQIPQMDADERAKSLLDQQPRPKQ